MIDSMMGQEKRLDCGANERQLNQKRQVRLKTCADVYEHWRSYKRLYKRAPSDGLEFQIDYIDTGLALGEEERSQAPIALALHGAPGSYHDFSLLISHLTKQKVRVIAPNFPEYVATVKTKVLFRHSADEKAAYLRDFLRAINVKKIDLLVSHSSAIFPTLLILLNANNEALAKQRRREAEPESAALKKPAPGGLMKRVAETAVLGLAAGLQLGSDQAPVVAAGRRGERTSGKQVEEALRGDSGGDGGGEQNDDDNFEDATDADELDGNNNHDGEASVVASKQKSRDEQIELETAESGIESDAQHSDRAPTDWANSGDQQTSPGATRPARRQKRAQSTSARRRKLEVVVQFDEPIEIKAVALFNPAGHRLPKSMKPTWFKCGSVHVYQHKLGRSIFRKFGPAFLTVVGVPVRVDNMDNVMLSATVMRNSKCQRVVRQLEQLSQMKIPTLLVFSENDKLIEKEIFYEMTQFMRLDSKNFDVFNNDGDIELSQSRVDDWIRVMVFKAGGHYAYSNYANTVNRAVSELLNKVTASSKSNNNNNDDDDMSGTK